MSGPLKIWFDRQGSLLRLRLDRPKANIVDAAMIAALDTALVDNLGGTDLKAVLLEVAKRGPGQIYETQPGELVLRGSPRRARDVVCRRGALAALYARLGRPPLYAKAPRWLSDDVEVSGTGLVLHKLLGFDRALHRDLLEPAAVDVLRRDMHLEFTGAVICDRTRPFFRWHHHVGGIDDERFRRLGLRPAIDRPERVAMLVYLDELAADSGQLLIWPHRVRGAAAPPGPLDARRWEGELAVCGPPGTVVMIDQTTWHAALPRIIDGPRYFFGLWFRAADAPEPERVDESLRRLDAADPLLRSLLPP